MSNTARENTDAPEVAVKRDQQGPSTAFVPSGAHESQSVQGAFQCTTCLRATDDHYCLTCASRLFATCTGCDDVVPREEMRDGECSSCRRYYVEMYGPEEGEYGQRG